MWDIFLVLLNVAALLLVLASFGVLCSQLLRTWKKFWSGQQPATTRGEWIVTGKKVLGLWFYAAVFIYANVYWVFPHMSPSTPPTTSVTTSETGNTIAQTATEAGTPLEVNGIWALTAGGGPYSLTFRHKISNDWGSITADQGFMYAEVPLCIKNISKETQSLSLFSEWKLKDDQGYTYDIESGADDYLPKDTRIDPSDVPPGAERCGLLVFQVREDVKDLYLVYSDLGLDRAPTWHFSVGQGTK